MHRAWFAEHDGLGAVAAERGDVDEEVDEAGVVAEGRADRLVDLVDEALVVVVFLAEL